MHKRIALGKDILAEAAGSDWGLQARGSPRKWPLALIDPTTSKTETVTRVRRRSYAGQLRTGRPEIYRPLIDRSLREDSTYVHLAAGRARAR